MEEIARWTQRTQDPNLVSKVQTAKIEVKPIVVHQKIYQVKQDQATQNSQEFILPNIKQPELKEPK